MLFLKLSFFMSFFLFLCRWRGAIHHISYKDDDGCLVDVCFNCHLLIYCQSCSLSYHHTDRKLHTVSIHFRITSHHYRCTVFVIEVCVSVRVHVSTDQDRVWLIRGKQSDRMSAVNSSCICMDPNILFNNQNN